MEPNYERYVVISGFSVIVTQEEENSNIKFYEDCLENFLLRNRRFSIDIIKKIKIDKNFVSEIVEIGERIFVVPKELSREFLGKRYVIVEKNKIENEEEKKTITCKININRICLQNKKSYLIVID